MRQDTRGTHDHGGIAAIIFSLGAGIFPIGIFIGMVSIMIGLACCKAF
ncbi:hypothetical protein [Candidatus Hamiltonella defensa]|nr:hypothetical protein [Candidatus Hamiltonella defensa]